MRAQPSVIKGEILRHSGSNPYLKFRMLAWRLKCPNMAGLQLGMRFIVSGFPTFLSHSRTTERAKPFFNVCTQTANSQQALLAQLFRGRSSR